MFTIEVAYCYPKSDRACEMGRPKEGGFYAQIGTLIRSPLFTTVDGARGWLRNSGLPVPPCHPGSQLGQIGVTIAE